MATGSESGTSADVSDMIRDVPDRLVSAERELERLCQWDIGSVSLEAKVTLVNCCRLLRASVSELLAMLEYTNTPSYVGDRSPALPDGGNASRVTAARAHARRIGRGRATGNH